MSHRKKGLFWFCNDLRLHDNPALMRANSLVEELVCVTFPVEALAPTRAYTHSKLGKAKQSFHAQSLHQLDADLQSIGQKLCYLAKSPLEMMVELIVELNISDVFRSVNAGWYENQFWLRLKVELQQHDCDVCFHSVHSHTLFDLNDLPFELAALPKSFTKFKHSVAKLQPSKPLAKIGHLPLMPKQLVSGFAKRVELPFVDHHQGEFIGGEAAALEHVASYFSGDAPTRYKQVRNELDGWLNSTKFSVWLANGNLSVREVLSVLNDYENEVVANDSTYWIYFELLWREYFQWYAHKSGKKLFSLSGIKGVSPLNSYYPERFKKWVNGTTPYPLVNACMRQLAATGFMSNRGRQIVASCFVNELSMDWRFGAAYFESVLIDYDIGSNWGNWQYLAGVGADTRDRRHFNLEKQTLTYDPDGVFINKWRGDQDMSQLDSVDAADWPI